MTKLLEQAIIEARKLPDARQNEAAQALLDVISQNPDEIQLSEAQVEELRRRLNDPTDTIASDEEVEATFRRLGV
jgi:hypothetical protein